MYHWIITTHWDSLASVVRNISWVYLILECMVQQKSLTLGEVGVDLFKNSLSQRFFPESSTQSLHPSKRDSNEKWDWAWHTPIYPGLLGSYTWLSSWINQNAPMLAFKMIAPIAEWKMDWKGQKRIHSRLFWIYGLLWLISSHALHNFILSIPKIYQNIWHIHSMFYIFAYWVLHYIEYGVRHSWVTRIWK